MVRFSHRHRRRRCRVRRAVGWQSSRDGSRHPTLRSIGGHRSCRASRTSIGRPERCISDVSVRGAPACTGLSVVCRTVRVSPQLDHYVPRDSDTDRYTSIHPFFRIWEQEAGSSNLPTPTTSGRPASGRVSAISQSPGGPLSARRVGERENVGTGVWSTGSKQRRPAVIGARSSATVMVPSWATCRPSRVSSPGERRPSCCRATEALGVVVIFGSTGMIGCQQPVASRSR